MARFNRSEITRNAWSLFRTTCKSFSDAMKQAWATAKAPASKAMQQIEALVIEHLPNLCRVDKLTSENRLGYILKLLSWNEKNYRGAIYLKNQKIELSTSDIETLNTSIVSFNQNWNFSHLQLSAL